MRPPLVRVASAAAPGHDDRVIADEPLYAERGGAADGPLIVLLHGMGHTAQVWHGLVEHLDGRGWLAVDLPGHGRSPWRAPYTFDGMAAAVAAQLPPRRPVLAVGHSMGGVVALALAAARPQVRGALGFGIKVSWRDDELATLRSRAARPPRVFASEGEAKAAFLRFGGLDGVVAPAGAAFVEALAGSAVVATEGGYRLAADPATMAVGAPNMLALLAAARAHAAVLLARGEHDQLVTTEQLRAVDPAAVVLPGVGHNVHVTDPERLHGLVAGLAGAPPAGTP